MDKLRNKTFYELLLVLYRAFCFYLMCKIKLLNVRYLDYKKIPIIYGKFMIRGRNGKISIVGNGRLRILGNIKIIFDDINNMGELTIHSSAVLEDNVTLSPRGGKIFIKENVFLGPNVLVQAYKNADILIEKNVMIAKDTSIFSTNHDISCPLNGYKDEIGSKIVIEEGVWIGSNCVITSGVKIGRYSIIGAGSVVTKDIPAYSIAVGSPCKVIKRYNKDKNIWERV